ncbi:MAG: ABC transporter ATP-binding protein/permease [Actinobacteria bacterium]|nr:ABC transporter ATP-binding protein/permease [Actinomycetota bacterium]
MGSNALVRCGRFARPYIRALVLAFVAGIAMTELALALPPITGAVIDDVRAGHSHRLPFFVGLIAVIGVVEMILAFLRRYTAARASISMEQDMRNELYAHLQRLPISFHDGWQSGQLLSRAMGDLSTIRRFLGFGLMFLIINLIQFLTVVILMMRYNLWLSLLTIVFGVPIVLLTWNFDRRYHKIARRVQDNTGDLATIIEESAVGIRIVKAFGRGEHQSAKFRSGADSVYVSSVEATYLHARFRALLRLLPNLNLITVLAIGGYSVIHGSLTPGDLATFVLYLFSLNWPIRSIGWILANAEEARTAAERFFEVIDTEPDIVDRPDARALPSATGRVSLQNVSFRYGSGEWILRDVTLDIEPGETLAVVGATGSGKTTLLSLVPRLYDVTEGAVKLDGVDVRDITLPSLRSHIRVAFEDPVLFSMSARENLLLGNPDATEDDMRHALETANASFVYDLPWGLDTRIGEQGYSLSGGQRQRLALARAVIGRPRVLVLDDPLSAVDVHTEAEIEAALAHVLQGVTALLVVHRPSTLALADRVALLHEGTIAAVGTHAELMERLPVYRDILSMEAEEVSR